MNLNEIERHIERLLASLVGNQDLTGSMIREILTDDIPDEWIHKDILRAIYECRDIAIAPSVDNLVHILKTKFSRKEPIEKIQEYLTSIVNSVPVSGPSEVRQMSVWATHALTDLRIKKAATEIHSIANEYEEADIRIDKMVEVFSQLVQRSSENPPIDWIEGNKQAIDHLIKMADERSRGLASGPSLKYEGFTGVTGPDGEVIKPGKVPFLRWGDTTVISGSYGTGKSMITHDIAEYNALLSHLGHDVLFLHLETEVIDYELRSIARFCKVPLSYLEHTNLDSPENEKLREKISQLETMRSCETAGQVRYQWCAGATPMEICSYITKAHQVSKGRGKGLIVVIDYYQLIDSSGLSQNRQEALGQSALLLKQTVGKLNKSGSVHLIVISQENAEGTAYGSTQILQYAQLHISIQRKIADNDLNLKTLDINGNRRPLHKKGDMSSKISLVIKKANHHSHGTVDVQMEGPMYRIVNLNNDTDYESEADIPF